MAEIILPDENLRQSLLMHVIFPPKNVSYYFKEDI